MRVRFAVEFTLFLYKSSTIFLNFFKKTFSITKSIVPVWEDNSWHFASVFSGCQFQLLPSQTGTIYIMSFVNHCKIASSNNLFQRCVNRYLLTRIKFLARVVCILRKQVFSYGGKFDIRIWTKQTSLRPFVFVGIH